MVLAAMLVAGCGSPPSHDSGSRLIGTISVYAPTSFTDIMAKLSRMFVQAHPGVDVRPTFGADTALVRDSASATGTAIVITQGPADLNGLAAGTAPVQLANTHVGIAVAPGDPKAIGDLPSLARPDLHVALCVETEPCGAASAA